MLTCTLAAKGPTRAAIVGTEGRIEIDGAFYAPAAFTLIPRGGRAAAGSTPPAEGRAALRGRRGRALLEAGLLESPLMPLDETVAIMRTMDAVSRSAAA